MPRGIRSPAHGVISRPASGRRQATAAKPVVGSWRHPPALHVSTVHGSPSSQPLDVPSTHVGSPGNVVVVVDGRAVVAVVDEVVVEEDVSAVVLVVVVTPTIVDVVVERVLVVTVVEEVVVLVVVPEHSGPGVWRQPLAGSQVSIVQTFPSSQLTGLPIHRSAKQASAVVQALPSSHGVPSATTVCVQTPA